MTDNASVVGTASDDTINQSKDTVGRTIVGLGGDDDIRGTAFADLVLAGWGDDTVRGGAGDDVIRGNDAVPTVAPPPQTGTTGTAPTGPATLTFASETAGYKNTVGLYKVSADGSISDVRVLFDNASDNAAGITVPRDLDVQAGDTLGFFLVSNAYGKNDASLLDPSLDFALRHPNSLETGTVGAGKPLELWSMDPITEAPRLVNGQYDTAVFHTATDANPDDATHARVTTNADGTMEVSFEDLANGGNEGAGAFGDVVFTLDLNGNDVRVLGSESETYTVNVDGTVTLGGTEYAVADTDTTVEVTDAAGATQTVAVVDVEVVDVNGTRHVVTNGEIVVDAQAYAVVPDDTGATLGSVTIGADEFFVEAGRTVTVDGTVHHLRSDGTFNIGGTTVTDADRLYGQDGDDTILGGAGSDRISGGTGDDNIRGDVGDDRLWGDSGADTIRGSEGDDRIYGGAGDDKLLNGGEGRDVVSGGAGDDLIRGGRDNDVLNGNDGDDRILGDSGADNIRGGAGDDRINGGTEDDQLRGEAGDDLLQGGKGDDLLIGGDETPASADAPVWTLAAVVAGMNDDLRGDVGDDRLLGGSGHDRLIAGSGDDRAAGGADNDFVRGDAGSDWLFGDDYKVQTWWGETTNAKQIANIATAANTAAGGDDRIVGGTGNDRVFGQGGDDIIVGDSGDDFVYGGHGDDIVGGGDGDDVVDGGAGNDKLYGGKNDDTVSGGEGDDLLLAGTGDDVATGGAGNDIVGGGNGVDTLDGGDGDDKVYGGKDDDVVTGGLGNDRVFGGSGDDTVSGGEGQDIVIGGSGNDVLNGGAAGDRLNGQSGDDLMNGDAGNDWLSGSSGVDVLNGGEGDDILHGGTSGDTLNGDAGADRLYGTKGDDTLDGGAGDDLLFGGTDNDTLTGGEGDDLLSGSDGTDVLDGGAGADRLWGGKGDDLMTGGAGNDLFVFGKVDRQVDETDTITDFAAGDRISLASFKLSDSSKASIVEDARQDGDTLTFRTSEWTLDVSFEAGDAAATAALTDLQDGTVPDWFVL